MKILVVSYLPWNDDISVGNTLSNIFRGMDNQIEFANIYFRDDPPNNQLVKRYYHISESLLAKRILTRKYTGKEITLQSIKKKQLSNSYNKVMSLRWELFLLLQDLIGILGNWKSSQLDSFVENFAPDIVFGPLGRMPVSNNLMTYISKKFNVPLITYPWDDHYSLKKLSFSPFFWIKVFIERHAIYKCAKQCMMLYTITEQMRYEYSLCFGKICKVLYKGYDFSDRKRVHTINHPIRMIYMGNIGSGRWKIIAKIAKAVNAINCKGKRIELYVYTMSPKSRAMIRALNVGDSHIMEPVTASEVLNTMSQADILLHVEPVSLKDKLFFRLSFSTKLVDYFYNAKCILAVGGNTASMRYLSENTAAIVETNIKNIEGKLKEVVDNPDVIMEYSEKSWNCGVKNHQIKTIQRDLYSDFCSIVKLHKDANQ